MKVIISKNVLIATVLLVFGLSFSTSTSADEYDFSGNGQMMVLPSERTVADAGIFAGSDDLFSGGRPQRIIDNGDGDGFEDGGGSGDCPDCYNDGPIGNGMYILMLMATIYGGLLFYRRRKEIIGVNKN